MMSTTELVRHQGVDIDIMDRLDTATFEELAETVTAAIGIAEAHAKASIQQLIRAGGALREMRDRMPGQYTKWLVDNEVNPAWAANITRLHVYRDHLPEEVLQPWVRSDGKVLQPSVSRAMAAIAELPRIYSTHQQRNLNPNQLSTAKRMIADGETMHVVARILGVSRSAIERSVADPTVQAARLPRRQEVARLKRAEQAALRSQQERQERDALAKTNGKELSVAYGAIRRALSALAKGSHSPTTQDVVDRATAYLTAAEGRVVDAMRQERAAQ